MTDIGADLAAAINGHLKALRLLNREDTTVAAVALALGLPEVIVERAFSEFKMTGAKINKKQSRTITKTKTEFSPIIELGRRSR